MLQRGPGLLAQDTCCKLQVHEPAYARFKEAQAFWPRIQDEGKYRLPFAQVASKRPRPFGPGYRVQKFIVEERSDMLQRGPGLLAQDTLD